MFGAGEWQLETVDWEHASGVANSLEVVGLEDQNMGGKGREDAWGLRGSVTAAGVTQLSSKKEETRLPLKAHESAEMPSADEGTGDTTVSLC